MEKQFKQLDKEDKVILELAKAIIGNLAEDKVDAAIDYWWENPIINIKNAKNSIVLKAYKNK